MVGATDVQLEGVPICSSPWRLEEEVAALRRFDIGLMPVPDDSWTRGKGGYKLLQYMAVGLPVVASPVGINTQIVRNGHTGYLATADDAWEELLARLIQDGGLRQRMGLRGRQVVEAEYSLRRAADVLAATLSAAIGATP